MYRIAVADDEAKACTMIKEIIQQYFEAKALECRVQAYQRPQRWCGIWKRAPDLIFTVLI